MAASYRKNLDDIYKQQHNELSDVYQRLRRGQQEKSTVQTHAGLWLDKYIEKQERDDVGVRAQLVREVATIAEPEIYEQFYHRWRAALGEKEDERTKLQVREAHTKGRMIVGLGGESVLETAITLHHTYGVPYIPGSALKGLTASYVRNYLDASWRNNDVLDVLFGTTDGAGYITFFDALYIPGTGGGIQHKALYPDIITVHHPQYYQGGTDASAPADWDSPIPIPFLSATGHYLIPLAAADLQEADAWLNKTFQILDLALRNLGIGAKTSSGYGRMTLHEEEIQIPIDPAITAIVEEIKNQPDKAFTSGSIDKQLNRWLNYEKNPHGKLIAQAIVDRVESSGNRKNVATKRLYQQLLKTLT